MYEIKCLFLFDINNFFSDLEPFLSNTPRNLAFSRNWAFLRNLILEKMTLLGYCGILLLPAKDYKYQVYFPSMIFIK